MNDEAGVEWLRDGEGGRYLQAHVGQDGSLHIGGHDPSGAEVLGSPVGYEWFEEIDAIHLGRLVELLDGSSGDKGR